MNNYHGMFRLKDAPVIFERTGDNRIAIQIIVAIFRATKPKAKNKRDHENQWAHVQVHNGHVQVI